MLKTKLFPGCTRARNKKLSLYFVSKKKMPHRLLSYDIKATELFLKIVIVTTVKVGTKTLNIRWNHNIYKLIYSSLVVFRLGALWTKLVSTSLLLIKNS